MSAPSLSPETGHVVSESGLMAATALVPSAWLIREKVTIAAAKIIPVINFEIFIREAINH
jgi:hypothetical protein